MSVLNQIKKGRIQRPYIITLHGPPGVGKTTFAADAPSPIFIPIEDGTGHVDTVRFDPQPKTVAEVMAYGTALLNDKHDYKSLAVDSLDALEPLIWQQVCKDEGVNSIEKVGYGKGYIFALPYWQKFLDLTKALRDKRGMHVIMICHSVIKQVKDPQLQTEYDRFKLKLHDKAAALVIEHSEAVLFANHEVVTTQDRNGKQRVFGDGTRKLYTEWRPSHECKNRLGLPQILPLDWAAFEEAARLGQPGDPEALRRQIDERLSSIANNQDLKTKVVEAVASAKDDAVMLAKILNRLDTRAQSIALAPQ